MQRRSRTLRIPRGRRGPFRPSVTECQTQPAGTGPPDPYLPPELGHCTIPIPQRLATCQLPPRGPLGRAGSNSCETPGRILPACSRAGSPAFPPPSPRTQPPQSGSGPSSEAGDVPPRSGGGGPSHRNPRGPEGRAEGVGGSARVSHAAQPRRGPGF